MEPGLAPARARVVVMVRVQALEQGLAQGSAAAPTEDRVQVVARVPDSARLGSDSPRYFRTVRRFSPS